MKKKKLAPFILLTSFILLVIVGDSLYYKNRLYPGIYVHQIPLGGASLLDVADILTDVEITFTASGNRSAAYRLRTLGIVPDAEQIFNTAYRAGRNNRPPLSYFERFQLYRNGIHLPLYDNEQTIKPSKVVSAIASDFNREPADAAYRISTDGRQLTVIPEAAGFRMNHDALISHLTLLLKQPQKELLLPVPGTTVPPAVTAKMLRKRGIQEPIGTFTTSFDGYAEDRVHNLKLAVSELNNLQIAPGETFSINQTLGDSTPEKGYRKAPIIVGTELVAGYGGGLCQISTTLYNAALLAGLDIVERHNHNMAIPYVFPGRDATISYGSRDLKFKNNTGHYLLMYATVTENELTFRLFGTPSGDRVVIEPEIVSTRPFPIKQVNDSTLPTGSEVITDGEPGYLVAVWKSVYRGDKLISREQISLDSYEPFPAVVRQGTGPLPKGG